MDEPCIMLVDKACDIATALRRHTSCVTMEAHIVENDDNMRELLHSNIRWRYTRAMPLTAGKGVRRMPNDS